LYIGPRYHFGINYSSIIPFAIMTQTNASLDAPPVLPASEDAYIKTLLSYRIRQRPNYVQNLVSTYKDALLPLLTELLATSDEIFEVPVPRPAEKESELTEEGGNPEPQVDIIPLRTPQTNAPSRYLQRSTGISMASTLAQLGVKPALDLLLANLRHPYTVGKKGLIQSIALNASDQDIVTAVKGASPAVVDSLVAALQKAKRKALSYKLMGKVLVSKVG
jgi:hypothetical protein